MHKPPAQKNAAAATSLLWLIPAIQKITIPISARVTNVQKVFSAFLMFSNLKIVFNYCYYTIILLTFQEFFLSKFLSKER